MAGSALAIPAYGIQQASKRAATGRQFKRARNVAKEISSAVSPQQASTLREGLSVAPAIAGALTPAGFGDLTKEQINQIIALPPEEAKKRLKRAR